LGRGRGKRIGSDLIIGVKRWLFSQVGQDSPPNRVSDELVMVMDLDAWTTKIPWYHGLQNLPLPVDPANHATAVFNGFVGIVNQDVPVDFPIEVRWACSTTTVLMKTLKTPGSGGTEYDILTQESQANSITERYSGDRNQCYLSSGEIPPPILSAVAPQTIAAEWMPWVHLQPGNRIEIFHTAPNTAFNIGWQWKERRPLTGTDI